jgi:archaemetzincin
VNVLYVAPVGSVAAELLEWIETAAAEWFPFPVRRLPPAPLDPAGYDPSRKQYGSAEILQDLARRAPPDTERILGITEGDLGLPVLTFVFGQAQLDGRAALVSLCRLRPQFYGLAGNPKLLRDRAAKETLHELGHTFGLKHCGVPRCAMALATHIAMVDAKNAGYCEACGKHLARRFTGWESTKK